ncbi:MAG: cbb3-type cytochrome c oxidase subunit I, partial [Proteobacteria bacterium]|nr:cbb3-type cytochrome c oxidase subunit I [Pseudomonadota bacterium]
WTFTMHGGNVILSTPMLYAIGFIGLFTIGGLTGLFLAAMGLDVPLHDTYFVVAHFHFTMVGGMTMAFFSGLHFWWPKMIGRMYPEFIGKFACIVIFVGFNLTFMPQFIVGWLGMREESIEKVAKLL